MDEVVPFNKRADLLTRFADVLQNLSDVAEEIEKEFGQFKEPSAADLGFLGTPGMMANAVRTIKNMADMLKLAADQMKGGKDGASNGESGQG